MPKVAVVVLIWENLHLWWKKTVGPFGYQVIPVMSLTLDPAVQLNRLLYYSSDFCYYHVLCSTSGGCTLLPK